MKRLTLATAVAGLGALSLIGVAVARTDGAPESLPSQAAHDCLCDEGDFADDNKEDTESVSNAGLEADFRASGEVEIEMANEGLETETSLGAEAAARIGKDSSAAARAEAEENAAIDTGKQKPSDPHDGDDAKKKHLVKKVKRVVAGLADCTFEVGGDKLRLVEVSAPGWEVDVDANSDTQTTVKLSKALISIELDFELQADGQIGLSIGK